MTTRMRSRSWIGTLNNYTQEELQQLKDAMANYVYGAIGYHVGEKSHLPHVHILIQSRNAQSMPRINRRIHWEKRRGTVSQAINYLNKESRLEEFGTRPSDPTPISDTWNEFVQSIHAGNVDKDSQMYARYRNYAEHRLSQLKPKIDYEGTLSHKNIWIQGPAGCGKSSMVRKTWSSDKIYSKSLNKWWDNYNDEPVVLIEDADPERCKVLGHHFKVWCDRYSFGAEIKNGRMQINPLYHLVVTSNYTIEECFIPGDVDPIKRRFDVLDFFK